MSRETAHCDRATRLAAAQVCLAALVACAAEPPGSAEPAPNEVAARGAAEPAPDEAAVSGPVPAEPPPAPVEPAPEAAPAPAPPEPEPGTSSGFGRGGIMAPQSVRVPSVRLAKAEIMGAIDRDIVRRIVQRHVSEVRKCYDRGLARDRDLMGRVVITFRFNNLGRILAASVTESTLPDPAVGDCVARAVKAWRFPSGVERIVEVRQPFVFEPG